jgi:hypothetical protein
MNSGRTPAVPHNKPEATARRRARIASIRPGWIKRAEHPKEWAS